MFSYKHTLSQVVKLAIPMAGSRFISMLASFAGILMLAHLGTDTLAASNIMNATQITLSVIGFSLLFSVSFVIGNAYGAKKYKRIGGIVQQGWFLGFLIALIVTFIFYFIKPILLAAGQDPSLAAMLKSYFHILMVGMIPLFWTVNCQQFCFAVKKQWLVIWFNLVAVSLVIIFSYLFIFGKYGFPKMGLDGFAVVQVAQYFLSAIYYTSLFYFHPDFKRYDIFKFRLHKTWHLFNKIVKVGWPMSLQFGGELLSMFVITMMVGWISIDALAAQQVVSQYMLLLLVPMFAISESTGILVSHARGAKEHHEIKKVAFLSASLGLSIMLLVAILFIGFPNKLAALYINIHLADNISILHLTTKLFFVIAISQCFDTLRNILSGALRGLYDTAFPMLAGNLSIWLVGMPLSYYFAFNLNYGVVGIAVASAIGITIAAVAVLMRWRIKCQSMTP